MVSDVDGNLLGWLGQLHPKESVLVERDAAQRHFGQPTRRPSRPTHASEAATAIEVCQLVVWPVRPLTEARLLDRPAAAAVALLKRDLMTLVYDASPWSEGTAGLLYEVAVALPSSWGAWRVGGSS